jgi:hypothetical protein
MIVLLIEMVVEVSHDLLVRFRLGVVDEILH